MDVPNRDRLLVSLDESPSAQVSRLAFGCVLVPLWAWLMGDDAHGWTLLPFLLFALAMLRVVPLIVRKAIPFSESARDTWAERRQFAKRYDSYQWQKMLWIGLGMLTSAVATGERDAVVLSLAAICVVSGAAGSIVWRRRNVPGAPADVTRRVLHEPARAN